MVVQAAVLVVGDDEQRRRPRRAGPQRPVGREDQRLAAGNVVVGVLTVAGCAPARFQERVGGQRAGRRVGGEIAELAEVLARRPGGVREVQPGERWRVVAVDLPRHTRRGHAAEDARHGENLCHVVHVALAGARIDERPVRHRHGRRGAEPPIAHRVPRASADNTGSVCGV